MERVLMLAGDAAEELEVYYILYRLREAGYAVDVAAPKRGLMRLVVHDFEEGWDTYVERPGRNLAADLAFSEVDPEAYVGVVVPGGRAPEVIRMDADVRRIMAHFDERSLPDRHPLPRPAGAGGAGHAARPPLDGLPAARARPRGRGRHVRGRRRGHRRQHGLEPRLARPGRVGRRLRRAAGGGRGHLVTAEAFDPERDYPLGTRRPDLVATPGGTPLAEVTLDGLRDGRVDAATCAPRRRRCCARPPWPTPPAARRWPRTWRAPAELARVPDDEILEIYTALRPHRSTEDDLLRWAARLEEAYGAHQTAAFVRGAIPVYSKRKLLLEPDRGRQRASL